VSFLPFVSDVHGGAPRFRHKACPSLVWLDYLGTKRSFAPDSTTVSVIYKRCETHLQYSVKNRYCNLTLVATKTVGDAHAGHAIPEKPVQ
jgi:hypothetical protein